MAPAELLTIIAEMSSRTDPYAVFEFLVRQDPQVTADVYQQLQTNLYWQQKNLPATIAFSQAGILHCLTGAARTTPAVDSRALPGAAKQLAYNLASFTWPGWDEPGIRITTSDLSIGCDAARLNLRLAEELDRPEKARANALWALGAHELAAGKYAVAQNRFLLAKEHAQRAGEAAMLRMLDGYQHMAQSRARMIFN